MDKITESMIAEANKVLPFAYAPYSKFSVASCVCTDKGNLYAGVNVENSSYGLTICAEGSALCKMVSAGEQRIKSIVILAGTDLLCSPCGACRQRIHEFAVPDTLIHLCNANSILQSLTVDELLPLAFDFKP